MSEIALKQFCSDDDSYRVELQKPFSIGEWTYATNGHICVRVPRRADVAESPDAPNASVLFAGSLAKPYAPIPRFSKPESLGPCASCDGDGQAHHCDSCSCRCSDCNGSGEAEYSVGLFGVPFAAIYVQLLQTLPNVLVAPSRAIVNEERPAPEDALPFRFDGGEGVLMPWRRPGEHHVDVVPR